MLGVFRGPSDDKKHSAGSEDHRSRDGPGSDGSGSHASVGQIDWTAEDEAFEATVELAIDAAHEELQQLLRTVFIQIGMLA